MKKFHYGGQAVIGGVMMRGQKAAVTAVRRPDGNIALHPEALSSMYTGWMRRAPLIRGVIVLIESMVLGIKSLIYSANVSLEEDGEEINGVLVWSMMAVALLVAVGLFFLLPLFLTRLFHISSPILFNLVDGLIRIGIFVTYLKLVTLMPDIKKIFAYHGAEHITVNAFEAGAPLEIPEVRRYATAHTRCGTSFLFVVMVVSILVFALTGLRSAGMMVLWRIILIPVIAAISYEVIFFGARHIKNAIVRAVLAPGMWLQKLTTREPDDSQIEVAILALKTVIELDQPAEVTPATPPAGA